MNDQTSSPGNNNNPNNRRHDHPKRRSPQPQTAVKAQAPQHNRDTNPGANANANANQGAGTGAGAGQKSRRRHGRNHYNRPKGPNTSQNPNQNPAGPQRPQAHGPQGINIERIYDRYLNLLDQHLIARKKYHDLFYRADGAQKNKLEKNFYNTLNELRDFESKLAPEARELFEKRNNGLRTDNIYTTNHNLPLVGEPPPPETEWSDPHLLQTQQITNYAGDREESVGNASDYLKYKTFS